jgi:hypothetical protein
MNPQLFKISTVLLISSFFALLSQRAIAEEEIIEWPTQWIDPDTSIGLVQ